MNNDPEFAAAWADLARQDAGGAPAPSARVPVEQEGRLVGSLPSSFNTRMARPTSFLYDIRPGDLTREADKIVAHRSLGMGDLMTLPGFVPAAASSTDPRHGSRLLDAVRTMGETE